VPLTLYGLKNCDVTRDAQAWLRAQKLAFAFHDYKENGLERATLERWTAKVGWEVLLNKRGTTFRGLSRADKDDIGEAKAVNLMLAHTSLIKRPVLEDGSAVLVGFDAAKWANELKHVAT
jgi:arsenate reductase (glutaredoxin)